METIKPPWQAWFDTRHLPEFKREGTANRTFWGCWRHGYRAGANGLSKSRCPYNGSATAPVDGGRRVATGERAMARFWVEGWEAGRGVLNGSVAIDGNAEGWSLIAATIKQEGIDRKSDSGNR